ncbi:MAG: hypothetical protein ACI915_001660 [Gammaproteobacteria bacterium]
MLIWRLGDGPNVGVAPPTRIGDAISTFAIPNYRAAAHGYFGHMWELYGFFALTPLILAASGVFEGPAVYLASFAAFCAGGFGCIACVALAGSATLCLLVPVLYSISTLTILPALMIWGMLVCADSPQFSAVAARACPPERVGGALALMNSIGFAVTIVAIEVVMAFWESMQVMVLLLLIPGPLYGLFAMRKLWSPPTPA